MVFSSASGKFVFRRLEAVITTSDVFKTCCSKQDDNVATLQKQQDFSNLQQKGMIEKTVHLGVFALCFYSASEDVVNGTIISGVIVQRYHILYMQCLL